MLNSWQERIPARVTSNLVLALYFINTIYTGYLAKTPANRELTINWHLLDVVKAGSVVLGVIILRKKISRNRFLLIYVCLVAEVVQLLSARIISGLALPEFMYQGILVGPTSDFAVLVTAALIVEAISNTRKGNKTVKKYRDLLKNIGSSLKEQLSDEENRLNREVNLAIQGAVSEIGAELPDASAADVNTNSITSALQRNINEVIRPLSHRLEFEEEVLELQSAKQGVIRFNPYSFLSHKISLGLAFNPEFIILILIGTILGTYLFLLDLTALLIVGIPTIGLTFFTLRVIHRAVKNLEVRVLFALIFNVFIAILTTSIFAFMNLLVKDKYEADSLAIIKSGALLSALVAGFGTIFYAYAIRAVADGDDLNKDLLKVVNSARNNLWAYRKTVARILHGSVQARFQASTLKLARAEEVNAELLQAVRNDLSAALGAVESPLSHENRSLSESLEDLVNLWSYACEMKIEISADIYRRFDGKIFATECALEVINEAITNAVKHGGAEKILVSATQSRVDLVDLVISNPTSSKSEKRSSGLGTKIIEEASQAFTSKISDGQYVLTASIFIEQ